MKPSEAALIYASKGFRVFPVHLDKTPATSHGVKDASTSPSVLEAWRGLFDAGGIGVACGGPMRLLVVDVDRKKGVDGSESLKNVGVLPPGPRVQTPSGGEHIYLRVAVGDAAAMRNAVGILPGVDVRWEGGYVVAPPTPKYVWLTDYENPLDDSPTIPLAPSWLIALLKTPSAHGSEAPQIGDSIPKGERNATLASIAGSLRRRGIEIPVIIETLRVLNKEKCKPPLPEHEVDSIGKSIGRYAPNTVPATTAAARTPNNDFLRWPKMDQRAFYGPLGECVQRIAPHSEADPNAMLLTLLACFGSACGRNVYYQVEGDRHYGNVFVCLVGDTSKGRKGTSWSRMRNIIADCDQSWNARIVGGLSSGEGLIYAVRDPLEALVTDKKTKAQTMAIVDPGVSDKRLMCHAPEFGGILKIVKREGNTLSATLRCAWDSGTLRVLTKNSPLVATHAHVSVVAHVTKQELLKHMDEIEIANGLGNRFLWAVVKRSQFLPLSAGTPPLEDLLGEISASIQDANNYPRQIYMTSDAEELWTDIYPALSEGTPGLAGALLARSESQTIRLAIIYALADRSDVITVDHLTAALCIVEYCRKSVVHIWGLAVGDEHADTIFTLISAVDDGLTMTEIHNALRRNLPAPVIHRALALLKSVGLVDCCQVKLRNGSLGRYSAKWYALPGAIHLKSVLPS